VSTICKEQPNKPDNNKMKIPEENGDKIRGSKAASVCSSSGNNSVSDMQVKQRNLRSIREASRSTSYALYKMLGIFKEDYVYFDEVDQAELGKKIRRKKPNKQPKIHTNTPIVVPNNAVPDPEKPAVFCICKGVDDGTRAMIQCDHCFDWFHFDCVGIISVFSFVLKRVD
jgi:hypothetical protein